MKNLLAICACMSLVALAATVHAQLSDSDTHDINIIVEEAALLEVSDDTPIFTITADLPAGSEFVVTPQNEDAVWIAYSSIMDAAQTPREITVEIDDMLAGMTLTVEPLALNSECGDAGTMSGLLTLAAGVPQVIVSEIGSVYTGTIADGDQGLNVRYGLTLDDCEAGQLFDQDETVVVTYTLQNES